MKLSNYISKFLINNGVDTAFVVTGGGAMHLDDAICHEKGMNVIYNHNEQALTMCAEGYARVSKKPALSLVTSGPGGTNAITGVMGAYFDSIPMIVISGQVKKETLKSTYKDINLRQLGDQECDIIYAVKNMTKFAATVKDPNDIAYFLKEALFLANSGRKGPVWLDIPLDVQGAEIDENNLRCFDENSEKLECTKNLDEETAKKILEKIKIAKAPLILVGTSIRLSGCENEFLKLVDRLEIPVVTAWNANDAIPYNNPYFVGMPGTVGTRSGNFATQNCDLLLSLGCRLNIRMIGYNHFEFAKNAYKIIVDIDKEELKKPTIKVDMPVNADVKDVIEILNKLPYERNKEHENWLYWCKKLFFKYPVVLPSYHDDNKNINPYVFLDKLFDELNEDTVIVTGNGSACVMTFQACKIKKGQRLFTNSGAAAMGYGFPASIGAAVSDKNKKVICIDGDGSFMMNLQELATVKYNNLNIKIIILNNNGYLSIKLTQNNMFKPPLVGVDKNSGICFPDFQILSKAFGIDYFRINNENEANDILKKVLEKDGPLILEVVVDENQGFSPKSSSKVMPDGRIVSSALEDMAPFLDEKELKENIYSC